MVVADVTTPEGRAHIFDSAPGTTHLVTIGGSSAACPIGEPVALGERAGDTRVDAPPPDELREELLYDRGGEHPVRRLCVA